MTLGTWVMARSITKGGVTMIPVSLAGYSQQKLRELYNEGVRKILAYDYPRELVDYSCSVPEAEVEVITYLLKETSPGGIVFAEREDKEAERLEEIRLLEVSIANLTKRLKKLKGED